VRAWERDQTISATCGSFTECGEKRKRRIQYTVLPCKEFRSWEPGYRNSLRETDRTRPDPAVSLGGASAALNGMFLDVNCASHARRRVSVSLFGGAI
jgi:hypothetical protein